MLGSSDAFICFKNWFLDTEAIKFSLQTSSWVKEDGLVNQLYLGRLMSFCLPQTQVFPGGSAGKESACSAGDAGPVPVSGRSSGGGRGNPLQYSCPKNPMDRGAWRATDTTKPQNTHNSYAPRLKLLLSPNLHFLQPASYSKLWTVGCQVSYVGDKSSYTLFSLPLLFLLHFPL